MRAFLLATCLMPLACDGTDGVAVPATTRTGLPLRWRDREIIFRVSPETNGIAIDGRLTSALPRAVATWNAFLRRCDGPRIVIGERLPRAAIRADLVNEVLFHRRDWCPPSVADFEDCYDSDLHASTRLRLRSGRESEIQEADIEVNGATFRWSLDGAEPGTLSLEAALVHELGHALGLDHPCSGSGHGAKRGFMSCSDAEARRGVMHPDAAEIQIGRRPEPVKAEVEMVCRNHARRE